MKKNCVLCEKELDTSADDCFEVETNGVKCGDYACFGCLESASALGSMLDWKDGFER